MSSPQLLIGKKQAKTATTHLLFPKRMKKHFGGFQGPGTLCQADSGRAGCGFGGIFLFQKMEHRCGHITGSCSSLMAFLIPRPPALSLPLCHCLWLTQELAVWEELLSARVP
jgi:hypothetical protein